MRGSDCRFGPADKDDCVVKRAAIIWAFQARTDDAFVADVVLEAKFLSAAWTFYEDVDDVSVTPQAPLAD